MLVVVGYQMSANPTFSPTRVFPSKVRKPVRRHASAPIFMSSTNLSITSPMSGWFAKIPRKTGLVLLRRKFLLLLVYSSSNVLCD